MSGRLAHRGLLLQGAGGGAPTYAPVLGLDFQGTNGSTTFTETTGKTAIVYGGAQISTAQAYTGSSSGLFNGTDAALGFASSPDFNMGASGWRIMFAIWMNSLAADRELFAHRITSNNDDILFCRCQSDGKLRFYSKAAAFTKTDITTVGTVSVGAWSVGVITRNQSTGLVTFDLDGNTAVTTFINDPGSYAAPATNFYIARGDDGGGYFTPCYFGQFLWEKQV